MRIIGYIEHPLLKITVFRMDGRVSVKFENTGYEQSFKLGEDERVSTLEGVRQLVDEAFVAAVLAEFQRMHQAKLDAFKRNFSAQNTGMFEEII